MMIKTLALIMALLLPTIAVAQTIEADEPIPIKGRWLVSHADRIMGRVSGRAVIEEYETRARVTLTDPVSGKDYILRSTSLERSGDQVTIELEGFWPGARDFQEQPLGAQIDVTGSIAPPEGADIGNMALGEERPESGPIKLDDLAVEYRGKATKLEVYKPGFPDLDTVTLTLKVSESALYGEWTFTANSQTGRDRKGNGRVGEFAFADDGSGEAEQSGAEVWSRPKPIIRIAMPTNDQTHIKEYGDAAYPYPWKKNGELVTPLADRRYILVVGENLPQVLGEGASFTSSEANISYHLQSKKKDFGRMGGDGSRVEGALERIRKQILQRMRAQSADGTVSTEQFDQLSETMTELRKQDMVIVRAELKNGAVPGLKGFTLDGTETSWVLRYGDFTADYSFVRPIYGSETDPLDYAFAPERVQLELRTYMDMPFQEIPVQVWVQGKDNKYVPHLFDGSRNIMAARLPITKADREDLAGRKADARSNGLPTDHIKQVYVWRTPPMVLIDDATAADTKTSIAPGIKGDWRIPVQTGTKLRGLIGSAIVQDKGAKPKVDNARYWLKTNPSLAEIGIIGATNEVAQFTLPGSDANNLTWTGALQQAATCAGVALEAPYDWYKIAQKKAHTFTNVIVLQGDIRDIDMTMGDHAAMLMLRDVFIESQQRQLNNLAAIDTYDEIEGFRANAHIPVNTLDNHPLADLRAPTPDGDDLSFDMSFSSDDFLIGRYGLTRGNLDAWRAEMTLEVIRQYRASIQTSLDMAVAAKGCHEPSKVESITDIAMLTPAGYIATKSYDSSAHEDTLNELAKLTSTGFGAMQRYAIARLVNTEATGLNTGAEWKADRIARSYVLGVPTFVDAVTAQQSLSEADTKVLLTSVAIGTSVAGAGAGAFAYFSASAYEATALLNLAMVFDVYSTLESVSSTGYGKYQSLTEVEFARGATASLGMQRLENALENDQHWASVIFSLYTDIAPELIGFDLHGFVRGPLSLLPSSKRLVSTAESLAEGRRILGVVDTTSSVSRGAAEATETATELATDAVKIADNFPNSSAMDDALGVDFNDFVSAPKTPDAPATPASPDAPVSTTPPNNVGSDTVMDAPNSAATAPPDNVGSDTVLDAPNSAGDTPPDNVGSDTIMDAPNAAGGAPAGNIGSDTILDAPIAGVGPAGNVGSDTVMDAITPSATLPQPNYQMRNPQTAADLPAIRADVDAAYQQAQAYAQEAFEQGRQLTRTEIANLEATAQAANTQELIEDAVAEARRAGVPEANINRTLAETSGNDPLHARLKMVRDLELEAVERLGFDIVLPNYADDVLKLASCALVGELSDVDIKRLRAQIEEAADRGEDFFEKLERQGTFDTYIETTQNFNPGAGFEKLADPDSIAALRRVAEDKDLIPDLTATNVTSQANAKTSQVNSLDDIRALPTPQRASVLSAMVEADQIVKTLGDGALDSAERVAHRLAKEADDSSIMQLPVWGRLVGREAYDRMRHLAWRADMHRLVATNPAQMRQMAQDPFSLEVFEGSAFNNMDELTNAIAKERKRSKKPFGDTFDEANPKTADPDGVTFKDKTFTSNASNQLGPVKYSETRMMVNGKKVGTYERTAQTVALQDGTHIKQMTMEFADGKDGPRFFKDARNQMTKHGMPVATMMNVRAFHNLDIPFGDPTLKRVKMSMVMNANTSVQIEWMKRSYRGSYEDFLKHTHSVRYAESALNQAGFKISRVELGPKAASGPAGHLVNGKFFNAKERPDAFLKRYGLKHDDVIETGHNIYIYVEPL